jgi:hypothetical protein
MWKDQKRRTWSQDHLAAILAYAAGHEELPGPCPGYTLRIHRREQEAE